MGMGMGGFVGRGGWRGGVCGRGWMGFLSRKVCGRGDGSRLGGEGIRSEGMDGFVGGEGFVGF